MSIRVRQLALLLLLAVAASNMTRGDDKVDSFKLPSKENFHLFLLVGQSNMAGRGKIEAQDRKPHERVLMLTKQNRWAPAVAPLHFDKPGIVGVGLGRSFGIAIAEANPDITVGLIPCAVGGSPIASWQPGGYHAQTKSHPWDDALARAKRAMKDGTLKGILWHQGESDAKPELAKVYEQKLHALIARFRQELNAKDVPFIAGQMGQFKERPWSEAKKLVDAAHRTLPQKVANTAFVDSNGLAHKGDQIHFDSKSYRELGRRYAKAYAQLAGIPKSASGGRKSRDSKERDSEDPEADSSGSPDFNTASESSGTKKNTRLDFRIERTIAHKGFDGKECWVHARAGAIPSSAAKNKSGNPTVVMTMQKLLLSGSDVFYALNEMRTVDLAKSWTGPTQLDSFSRQRLNETTKRLLHKADPSLSSDNIEITVCDFTPKWHTRSGKLLGTGQTVWYQNNRVMHVRPRRTAFAVYDPVNHCWSPWKRLSLPEERKFLNAGSGSVQRYDLNNGDVLLPIYFKDPKQRQYSTTVCRCKFDGETLKYVEHGSELTVSVKRGLYEPSLTKYQDRFYLTMRNDDHGYVSVSPDGLNFEAPRRWTFDDGSDLGNYNTQQHWVTHSGGLFLVYTRRGAKNDHVFRHRAPLFIARVDTEKLQVIRATERVLVPQRGARLGNFGVVDVSSQETWVTVTEWMQPLGVEKYGSDNSVFVAKLKWSQPNGLMRE